MEGVEISRVVYQHYRIPLFVLEMIDLSLWHKLSKGQPSDEILYHYRKGVDTWMPATKGGKTVCIITATDGTRFTGVSYCSLADAFNYGVGRGVAFRRASTKYIEHRVMLVG